jgi:hypothetical protein
LSIFLFFLSICPLSAYAPTQKAHRNLAGVKASAFYFYAHTETKWRRYTMTSKQENTLKKQQVRKANDLNRYIMAVNNTIKEQSTVKRPPQIPLVHAKLTGEQLDNTKRKVFEFIGEHNILLPVTLWMARKALLK